MKIGILTSGGDCPGINTTIRAIGKTAILKYNMEIVGINNGFLGLLNKDYQPITEKNLSGIIAQGGTILGTSRESPFIKLPTDIYEDKPTLVKYNYQDLGLDCLICVGGNGTIKNSIKMMEMGLNVVSIPKTIDNDVFGTDKTFGFDTAVNIATDAIDRLHSTASAHNRVMVIEVMGRQAGWLALHSGIAGGCDVILLPEMQFDMERVYDKVLERSHKGKSYSIIVVAEGIDTENTGLRAAEYVAQKIKKETGIETRQTVLGYIQRGGSPSPYDRILASQFGSYSVELIAQRKYNHMVAMQNDKITSIPLTEAGGKLRLVDPNNALIEQAKGMGICFG
ncbi:MAG: 6-phosphofructokinase [Paludibacteraceae bacterium]|nr:6-phosphofructokinase [Paludibacteraceae bacterium]